MKLHTSVRFLYLVAALAFALAAAACGTDRPPAPEAGEISLAVALFTKDGTITAGEPVLGGVQVANCSGHAVEVDWGNDSTKPLRVEVRDKDGKVLAATPLPRPDAVSYLCVARQLAPGEAFSKVWVISALYGFEKPGIYTVNVRYFKVDEVVAEAFGTVRVLAFDSGRLAARCDQIFRAMRKGAPRDTSISGILGRDPPRLEASSEETFRAMRTSESQEPGMPLGLGAHTLYSVRHDEVLPYLEKMVRLWSDPYACEAMRRALQVSLEERSRSQPIFWAMGD